MARFLNQFDRQVATNVAFLPPTARPGECHGPAERRATPDDLRRMQARSGKACATARSLQHRTDLRPLRYGELEELVALCSASNRYGSVFMPHLRSYGTKVVEATEEAVEIARRSGIPLHLTHHQVVFDCNAEKHPYFTQVIDDARAEGLDVTCDSYPYAAGSTFMIGFFPGWAQGLGRQKVVELLQQPDQAERLRQEVEVTGCDGTHGVPMDWARVQVSGVQAEAWRGVLGRRLADLAAERGLAPWELVRRLLIENDGQVNVVSFFGHEHAVQHIMRHPTHMVGSDGILVGDNPHPRVYGTFPRYLGRYVRELGVLDWETCVRQMTGMSAARIGLVDRGLLKVGFRADITMFDPQTVQDTATFEQPKQFPLGMPYVIVNGRVVKDQGEHTGVLAGRALRRGRATV